MCVVIYFSCCAVPPVCTMVIWSVAHYGCHGNQQGHDMTMETDISVLRQAGDLEENTR